MLDVQQAARPSSPASAPEARSGLDPWVRAELPLPPIAEGFGWISVVGPGVIVLGASIGSGEFLLGPAVFVRYGFSILWVTMLSVLFQTLFNMEVMRYTLATGEPVFTGFMRTRPSSTAWAWFWAAIYFLQVGWPAWAATAAGAIFFLFERRLPEAADAGTIFSIGVGTFMACVAILSVGRRIERTLEILNWVLVTVILGGFLVLAGLFVPGRTWLGGLAGLFMYSVPHHHFVPLPPGMDFVLLGALVAYSGAGGVTNVTLSNWARDKGYGMGERAGYISAAIGGKKVHLAHSGFYFPPEKEGMRRWNNWWRVVKADQWGVFFTGALLGMLLPGLLYVTFLPAGTDIRGLGISAALASAVGNRAGPMLAGVVAFLGAWILFKTQLDQLEGMVRAITDIVWTGSRRVRETKGLDVRAVYYGVLAVVVLWGILALKLVQPVALLLIGANIAGGVLVIASLHLLYINTRLLPAHVRPPMWRRVALVAMALFYGFFLTLSVSSLLRA